MDANVEDEDAILKPIYKPTYWQRHFGTDMLMASWLLLFGAIVYLTIAILYLAYTDYSTVESSVLFEYCAYVFSAVAYIWASILLLEISYPEVYERTIFEILTADVEKMTWTQRYFTGNVFLEASWWIFIATVPLIVYPIWATSTGELEVYIGVVVILLILVFLSFKGLWVVSCLPDSFQANDGRGSSYFYDYIAKPLCCGCCCCYWMCCLPDNTCHRFFGSDFLASIWLIFIFAIIASLVLIVVCAIYYSEYVLWLYLLNALLFAAGFFLLGYTSLPENVESTVAFDFLTCSKSTPRPRGIEVVPLVGDDEPAVHHIKHLMLESHAQTLDELEELLSTHPSPVMSIRTASGKLSTSASVSASSTHGSFKSFSGSAKESSKSYQRDDN
jgi:hypothetical protein